MSKSSYSQRLSLCRSKKSTTPLSTPLFATLRSNPFCGVSLMVNHGRSRSVLAEVQVPFHGLGTRKVLRFGTNRGDSSNRLEYLLERNSTEVPEIPPPHFNEGQTMSESNLKEQNQSSFKNDSRPMRYSWAPGGYIHNCPTCKENFVGDKRAQICADCAYALPDPTPQQNQEAKGKWRITDIPSCKTNPIWIGHDNCMSVAAVYGEEYAQQIIDSLNAASHKPTRQHSCDLPGCVTCNNPPDE
jgi:hypothetical protein